jgi:hypothetical protein
MTTIEFFSVGILGMVLGAIGGSLTLVWWWLGIFKNVDKATGFVCGFFKTNPEIGQEILRTLHKRAHPHVLQVSLLDPTPICPCCGWTEPGRRSNEPAEAEATDRSIENA